MIIHAASLFPVLPAAILSAAMSHGPTMPVPLTYPAGPYLPGADQLVLVQGCGTSCGQPPTPQPIQPFPSGAGDGYTPPAGISPQATAAILKEIGAVNTTCGSDLYVPKRYRVDCMRQALWQLYRTLPKTGDYAPVARAVRQAALDLDAIVARYGDPSAPVIYPPMKGKPLAPRLPATIAIREKDERRAMRAATAAIERAETMLLRSAVNAETRREPFQQIAAALDDTTILLRSS